MNEPSFVRVRDPWQTFVEALTELAERSQGTAAWARYVLLIDDADMLFARGYERHLDVFAKMVRGELAGGPAALVLGGGRLLRECLLDGKASVFASLRPLFLGVLRKPEAAALVRSGLPELDERVLDELLRASGRHPFVLQRLLAELEAQEGNCDVAEAMELAHHDVEQFCEALWHMFDLERGVTYRGTYAAPEHALMQLLLDYGTAIDTRTAELQLGIKPLKEFAELLEYAGVAERVLKADLPYLKAHFELWNSWYAERILE